MAEMIPKAMSLPLLSLASPLRRNCLHRLARSCSTNLSRRASAQVSSPNVRDQPNVLLYRG